MEDKKQIEFEIEFGDIHSANKFEDAVSRSTNFRVSVRDFRDDSYVVGVRSGDFSMKVGSVVLSNYDCGVITDIADGWAKVLVPRRDETVDVPLCRLVPANEREISAWECYTLRPKSLRYSRDDGRIVKLNGGGEEEAEL